MLVRLIILALALPAMALAADAPAPSAKIRVVAPAAARRQSPVPAPSPVAPTSASAWAAPSDPAQCRMSCAQANYFCRASDHPDDCAGPWTQCVAGCTSANLASSVLSAP
jgi:hypothetical protein